MAAGAGALVEAAGVLGGVLAVLGGVLAVLGGVLAGLGVAALDEVAGAVALVAAGVVTRERVVG